MRWLGSRHSRNRRGAEMDPHTPTVSSGAARLADHAAGCDECRAAPLPMERLAGLLERVSVDLDPVSLSQQALTRLGPELQRRAAAITWRRVVIGVALSLLPLPVVLAYDAYCLQLAYNVLSALLPAGLAAYFILSYAAFLVLLFAATYAAIPILISSGRRTSAADYRLSPAS
jgi:hypothetical protein